MFQGFRGAVHTCSRCEKSLAPAVLAGPSLRALLGAAGYWELPRSIPLRLLCSLASLDTRRAAAGDPLASQARAACLTPLTRPPASTAVLPSILIRAVPTRLLHWSCRRVGTESGLSRRASSPRRSVARLLVS